ncbi:hypothetical protein F4802DRAFT_598521 [Xylaria palmicola]|nr:hypothetical protein F4802DRAFT_598521 [Xylaria palmicola]
MDSQVRRVRLTMAPYLLGFSLPGVAPFPTTDLEARFYQAVVGPASTVSVEYGESNPFQSGVRMRLEEIFGICLQASELYMGMRDLEPFWRLASEYWGTLEPLEWAETAGIVEAYRAAREKCKPNRQANRLRLPRLVDSFITVHSTRLEQGPIQKFIVPSLCSWLPPSYTEQEVAWLYNDYVLPQAERINFIGTITSAEDIPTVPDMYAHPLDVRLFLAFTSLVNLSNTPEAAICMAPITFEDVYERRAWYQATGGASKHCWTVPEFVQWADKELRHRRLIVIGLCHFHCFGQNNPWEAFEESFDPAQHGEYDLDVNKARDFKAALEDNLMEYFPKCLICRVKDVPNVFEQYDIKYEDTVSKTCNYIFFIAQRAFQFLSSTKKDTSTSDTSTEVMRSGKEDNNKVETKMALRSSSKRKK